MIRVNIKKDNITVSGHANYDKYGKDIVCASVSSIIYTTINGILNINSDAIKVTDDKELNIQIISNDLVTKSLINNMVMLLQDLEEQYPENLKIK